MCRPRPKRACNYETFGWLALLGPAGMPKPVVDKLYQALEEAVNDPTVRSRFVEQGAEPVSPGPEELKKFIASETAKWREAIIRRPASSRCEASSEHAAHDHS